MISASGVSDDGADVFILEPSGSVMSDVHVQDPGDRFQISSSQICGEA